MIDRAVMLFPHLIDNFGVDMTFSFLSPWLHFSSFNVLIHSSSSYFFVMFLVFTHLLWSLLPSFVFLLSFMFAFETEQFEHKREIIEFDHF